MRFYSAFAHILGFSIQPSKSLFYMMAQETAEGSLLQTKPARTWPPSSSPLQSPSCRHALIAYLCPGIFCACGIPSYSVPSVYSLLEWHGHDIPVSFLSGPRQHRNSRTHRANTVASVVRWPLHTYFLLLPIHSSWPSRSQDDKHGTKLQPEPQSQSSDKPRVLPLLCLNPGCQPLFLL